MSEVSRSRNVTVQVSFVVNAPAWIHAEHDWSTGQRMAKFDVRASSVHEGLAELRVRESLQQIIAMATEALGKFDKEEKDEPDS